jgi:hypothetical protein
MTSPILLEGALIEVADSILYVSSLLANQARPIDQIIDYFGGAAPVAALPLETDRQRPREAGRTRFIAVGQPDASPRLRLGRKWPGSRGRGAAHRL